MHIFFIVIFAVISVAVLIEFLMDKWRDRTFYKTVRDTIGNMHIGPKQAWEIYQLYTDGKHSQRKLATMYGISQRTVGRIVERLEWLDYAQR